MTGLGPEWTGPGGIGDYAKSNGNTAEIVNAAHGAIRNHERDSGLHGAKDTGESYDLVVIGCGIAGLSAGYTYHKARPSSSVLMLDLAPDLRRRGQAKRIRRRWLSSHGAAGLNRHRRAVHARQGCGHVDALLRKTWASRTSSYFKSPLE